MHLFATYCLNPDAYPFFRHFYISHLITIAVTNASTATSNLASITVPFATCGCPTRNVPTTVLTVVSAVSAGVKTFVTAKIVECVSISNYSLDITARLASI